MIDSRGNTTRIEAGDVICICGELDPILVRVTRRHNNGNETLRWRTGEVFRKIRIRLEKDEVLQFVQSMVMMHGLSAARIRPDGCNFRFSHRFRVF